MMEGADSERGHRRQRVPYFIKKRGEGGRPAIVRRGREGLSGKENCGLRGRKTQRVRPKTPPITIRKGKISCSGVGGEKVYLVGKTTERRARDHIYL